MQLIHPMTRWFMALMFVVGMLPTSQAEEAAAQTAKSPIATAAELLTSSDFDDKARAIEALAKIEDAAILPIFEEMLAGKLHYIKETQQVVFIAETDDGYNATSVDTGQSLGTFSKSDLKKITVNNSLRRQLNNEIAQLKIRSPNIKIRQAAVEEIVKTIDASSVVILQTLLAQEKDEEIRAIANIGMALWDLQSDDKQIKLQAISTLSESLMPKVKAQLEDIAGTETDADIKKAALKALAKIEEKIKFYGFLENLVFGLSLGSILLLVAIGLSITFGVMGVINMAHGELMMLGAYTTFVVQQMMPDYINASIFISIPLAFLVAGFVGVLIERFVIRFLYGRALETLLATFGVSLILQQLVRSIFGPTNQAVQTPSFMSGSMEINSIFAITYNRFYIFIFSLLVFAILLLILKKTRLGLQVRAVAQNRTMAKAMGVRSEWVDAMTFGLGSGIAGVAGVALSQLTNVGPNLGQGYIIDSFMVVVFGGVGNLWGTVIGGLSLGVLNKFLEPWSGAVLAKILVLVLIILFIQKRPRGLFPQKGRAAEN